MAANYPPPVAFTADEDEYLQEIAAVVAAGPAVLNNTRCVTAGTQDDTIYLAEVHKLRAVWSQARVLRLWIEDDQYEYDWNDRVAELVRSLEARSLSNLRALHIYQELPSQLISSILLFTPRLEDLEAIPEATLDGDTPPSSPGHARSEVGGSRPSYPSYQCRLRRLAFIGDDMLFFRHLFDQSRSSLWWLMLSGDQIPAALPSLEEENCVRHLFAPFSRRCDEVMDAATAHRAAAAFHHLRVLLISTDELVAFPELLSHVASSLTRIVLASVNTLTQTAGVAVLADALRSGAPAVRQLREVSMMHDQSDGDVWGSAMDTPFFGEEVIRVLRLECQAKRVMITRKLLNEEDQEGPVPSVISMLGDGS
ncbi:hypothetical protein AURDEDRAFT_183817 [Auricularia subglabra TFB-10046 SS5]|nr:hypothetical protein AURDEDRAFT_183817 [Auricularia subglabra TFB-10046 SS5]